MHKTKELGYAAYGFRQTMQMGIFGISSSHNVLKILHTRYIESLDQCG